MRELADAFAYSLFLAPAAGILALTTLWLGTAGRLGLIDLLVEGVPPVARLAPGAFVAAVLVYTFSAFVLAEIVGATRFAGWVRSRLVTRLQLGEGLTDEPIWWSVFEIGARDLQRKARLKGVEVFLNVHMAGGGRYTGVLQYFTVAPDTEANRDFSIWKARYYAPDGSDAVVLPPDDIVVLNGRDCRAIEVRYVPRDDIKIVPEPATLKLTSHAPSASVQPTRGPQERL